MKTYILHVPISGKNYKLLKEIQNASGLVVFELLKYGFNMFKNYTIQEVKTLNNQANANFDFKNFKKRKIVDVDDSLIYCTRANADFEFNKEFETHVNLINITRQKLAYFCLESALQAYHSDKAILHTAKEKNTYVKHINKIKYLIQEKQLSKFQAWNELVNSGIVFQYDTFIKFCKDNQI